MDIRRVASGVTERCSCVNKVFCSDNFIVSTRRYCDPSCLFVCFFVRLFVCSLVCSFVSSHPATADRCAAGGNAAGRWRCERLAEVYKPCMRALLLLIFLNRRVQSDNLWILVRLMHIIIIKRLQAFFEFYTFYRPIYKRVLAFFLFF